MIATDTTMMMHSSLIQFFCVGAQESIWRGGGGVITCAGIGALCTGKGAVMGGGATEGGGGALSMEGIPEAASSWGPASTGAARAPVEEVSA